MSDQSDLDVQLPPPSELVDRLVGAHRRSAAAVAVLDPAWPSRLTERAVADLRAAADEGRLAAGDLVVFTSGSSGRPRGVVRTLGSWDASLAPLTDLTGIGEGDIVWLPGPLTSSLSLYGAYHAAMVGVRWLHAPLGATTSRSLVSQATCAHLVPTALADACDLADLGGLPLLRTVVVAGAHLSGRLRDRAHALGWQVVEYYGAAELSFVGWRRDDGPMRDFPGAVVQVVGDELWVRSPYLARGYLAADDAGPMRVEDGWATVGDHGRAEGDGWTVTGRGDTAVVTGGHTVLAEEVEALLAGVDGVRDLAVVGVPHGRLGQAVVAVVVLDAEAAATGVRPALVDVARRLPAAARPRRWLVAVALPRTPGGKVDRTATAGLAPGLRPLR